MSFIAEYPKLGYFLRTSVEMGVEAYEAFRIRSGQARTPHRLKENGRTKG